MDSAALEALLEEGERKARAKDEAQHKPWAVQIRRVYAICGSYRALRNSGFPFAKACHCGRQSYSPRCYQALQQAAVPKLTRLALKACKSRVSSLRRPSSCIMRQDAMASHSCTHDVSAACAQHPSFQTTHNSEMCRRSRSLACHPRCAGNMPPRPRRERQATQ